MGTLKPTGQERLLLTGMLWEELTPPSTTVEKHHDRVKAAFPGTPPPLPTTFPSAMAR